MQNIIRSLLLSFLFIVMVSSQTVVPVKQLITNDSITKTPNQSSISTHIVSGVEAPLGLIPWQAALSIRGRRDSWFCGGTLIHTSWVLTAAHCMDGARGIAVRLGSVYHSNEGTELLTNLFYSHPAFNNTELYNDIALIKLLSPAPINSNIKVIKILPKSMTCCNAKLRQFRISGWGLMSDASTAIMSNQLMFASVTETTDEACITSFGASAIIPTILCAKGGVTKESTCNGDSGGPLVLLGKTSYLVGINSFVASVGCTLGHPAGFTEVTPYLDWIRITTGESF